MVIHTTFSLSFDTLRNLIVGDAGWRPCTEDSLSTIMHFGLCKYWLTNQPSLFTISNKATGMASATKAVTSCPEAFVDYQSKDKAGGLPVLKVQPLSRAAGQGPHEGGHVSQSDRFRIKCLGARNVYNALVTIPYVTSRNSHFRMWTIFPTRNIRISERIHLF
jgi:hypothetical protein